MYHMSAKLYTGDLGILCLDPAENGFVGAKHGIGGIRTVADPVLKWYLSIFDSFLNKLKDCLWIWVRTFDNVQQVNFYSKF